jgi:hypothetical protein
LAGPEAAASARGAGLDGVDVLVAFARAGAFFAVAEAPRALVTAVARALPAADRGVACAGMA